MTDKPCPSENMPCPPVEEHALTAAGGWCAPPEVLYDQITNDFPHVTLPGISVQRGTNFFPEPGTPEYARQQARFATETRMREVVARETAKWMWRRKAVIEQAVRDAEILRMDVHVHDNNGEYDFEELTYKFVVGIEFTPMEFDIPTLHYHRPERTRDSWHDY